MISDLSVVVVIHLYVFVKFSARELVGKYLVATFMLKLNFFSWPSLGVSRILVP